MPKHNQIQIYNPMYENTEEVDEGIAELLEQLWALDILTLSSCQESQPGTMWLFFPNFAAERFLTVVASSRDDEEDPSTSLYCRMMGMGWGGDWDYTVHTHDFAEKLDEATDTIAINGKSNVALKVAIHFPTSDYAEVLEIVKNYEEPPGENEDESNSSPFSLN